jgi:hypothetical protein
MVTVPLRSGRTDTWASSNSVSHDKRPVVLTDE